MKTIRLVAALLMAAAVIFSPTALAFREPDRASLPDVDKRRQPPAVQAAERPERAAAAERLRARVPGVQVNFDSVPGRPKMVSARDGFLSGPNGEGRGVAAAVAREFKADDPHRATRAFLKEHRALFGHGPEALDAAKVKREFVTAHNGLRTVVWEQQVDGIPVFEAVFIAHTTQRGELVNLSSQFVPAPERAADKAALNWKRRVQELPVSARQAVALGAAKVGDPVEAELVEPIGKTPAGATQRQHFKAVALKGDATANLVWLPVNAEELRLCWDIVLTSRSRGEMFRLLVDAQSGEVLLRRCLTKYLSEASYRVFTSDSPSPFSPGHSQPFSYQPSLTTRSLQTLDALNTNTSPLGWVTDNETLGNNVDAHLDRDDNDQPDLPRPPGAPARVFDFPLDLATSPTNSSHAAVAQLFHWCNWAHDTLHDLGFTEATGNFQTDNLGRGGQGGDALLADAQDGGGANNANVSVPPDGQPPRMQMYLWTGPTPDRDGDFDAEIILHEYVHGLSERLVGGGVGLWTWQAAGLGEGWSDWYALALLSEPGDDVDACYASGAYLSYQLGGLTNNYYFGIRRYPYCTDTNRNPLTFKDIDPYQAIEHRGVPLSPLHSPFDAADAAEVHREGEVWCVTLWEARANLIRQHGFASGNRLALQLVTDGMKLSPPNPTFVQARDAILQADLVNNGGANLAALWAAFAKRGLGLTASSPEGGTPVGVHEAFDAPGDLALEPLAGFVARGPAGGPFTPDAKTFHLLRIGSGPVAWSAVPTVPWLVASPASGVMKTNEQQVIISLDPVMGELPAGAYTGAVRFENLSGGAGVSVGFTLHVGQPDCLTEQFFFGQNDLAFQSLTFIPDGSPSFYRVCREPASELSTDPLGGTQIGVGDDGSVFLTLSGTNTVSLFGLRTNAFFVNANGNLTMGKGDWEWVESLTSHFRLPRVSVLFDDFDTEHSGGSVSWRELDDRVAVTYLGVGEYGRYNQSTFQVEWFFDGRIRLTYLRLDAPDGLVGLSRGGGVPEGFGESDFMGSVGCGPMLDLELPVSASEGDGVLAGQAAVWLTSPLATNLAVDLTSSDVTEAAVPAQVIIPAGATNAVFDLAIVDDSDLDGTRRPVITASAPGFRAAPASVRVFDDEQAELRLDLPAAVREGDGWIDGTLSVNAPPTVPVVVTLASSDTSELVVPAVVIIPAGQTTTVFTASVPDDAEYDGTQAAIVAAQVMHWANVEASVTVQDDETPRLEVLLPAESIEGQEVRRRAGAVRLGGTFPTNFTVFLRSLDLSEVHVPANVVVPAGQASASFDLVILDDAQADGAQKVTVMASAHGFGTATNTTQVLDNGSPLPPERPMPADLAAEVPVTTALSWTPGSVEALVNGGFERGDCSGWFSQSQGTCALQVTDGRSDSGADPRLRRPIEGTRYALADSPADGSAVLWQELTLPAGASAATLTWVQSLWKEGYEPFLYCVEIRDTNDALLSLLDALVAGESTPNGWARCKADLNAFLGQTVRVAFVLTNTGESAGMRLDDIHLRLTFPTPGSYNVYFGTNATPSPAEFLGSTTATNRTLPTLTPLTKYYWRVVARSGGSSPGPVWQFTTRGPDHFDWSTTTSPQRVGDPFRVGIAARDEVGRIVSSFSGPAHLSGVSGSTTNLFRDDFEDGDGSDWTFDTGPGYRCEITSDAAAKGGRSLTILGGWAPPSQWGVGHSLSNVRPSRVSFHLRAATTNTYGGCFALDGETYTGVLFSLAPDGTMGLGGSDGWRAVPYEPLRWYKITLLLDWEAFALDYLVDDQVVSTGVPFYNHVDAFVRVRLYNQDYTQCWWDQIEVVTGPVPKPVSVAPEIIGPFDRGVWVGDVAVLEPATRVQLVADDGHGNTGTSGAFDVLPWNDVGLGMTVSPPAARVGEPLTFVLVVTNTGPTNASGVVVTSVWPAHAEFVNATTSQGAFSVESNRVVFHVGALAGPGSASLSVTLTADSPREVSLDASVARAEGECFTANNSATALAAVWPTVSISDAVVREGHTGVSEAEFVVTLSCPFTEPVVVSFEVEDSSAPIGSDFSVTPGPLLIPPGHTNARLRFQANGDIAIEPDETFSVVLIGAEHALIEDARGEGTIANDDGLPGEIASFEWGVVSSPQWAGEPFAAMVSARDAAGNLATNFTGCAALAGRAGLAEASPLSVEPSVLSNFVDGVWTGPVTVLRPATELMLVASDLAGHSGDSGDFDVLATNDLALTMFTLEEFPEAGQPLLYSLRVTNSGPADSTGVVVSNRLPACLQFLSATTGQGTFSHAGDAVVFQIGTLVAGQSAEMSLRVLPTLGGMIVTNLATVTRNEPEGHLANNRAEVQTYLPMPRLLLDDVSVLEGDAGAIDLLIPLRLSAACTEPITVLYHCYDREATAYQDYLLPEGEFTLSPGVFETNLVARVRGETLFEANESFEISAYILETRGQAYGVVTILNDDPPPAVSINDATVREGNAGTTNAVFAVNLSIPCGVSIFLDYSTSDGSALAGKDYVPQTRTLEFPPGTTCQEIGIAVLGDMLAEANETFFVRLDPTTNVVLADGEGIGTILNDDGAPGDLAWLEWSSIASPQYVGTPFAVVLTARDVAGDRATSFEGHVALSALRTETWAPRIGSNSEWTCAPLACTAYGQRAQVIYVADELGRAARILSLGLDVTYAYGQTLGWTVRMKHTGLNQFGGDLAWEGEGWTVVLQTNLPLASIAPGWLWLSLNTPFDYNGVDSLMIDFSAFANGQYASASCYGTSTDEPLVLFHSSSSNEGDPLSWAGSSPVPETSATRPNIRFEMSRQITFPVQPSETDAFSAGLWTGNLALAEPATNLVLVAEAAGGSMGVSQPLAVDSAADGDADGLPDCWELSCFGSTNATNGGPEDDADGDGLTNEQEFRAGTNPRDAASVLRVVSVEADADTIRVRFTTVPGKRYELEGAPDLVEADWGSVGPSLIGTGGVVEASLAGGAEPPARFYRVRLLQ